MNKNNSYPKCFFLLFTLSHLSGCTNNYIPMCVLIYKYYTVKSEVFKTKKLINMFCG